MRLLALSSLLILAIGTSADPSAGSSLYPPGLLPLINRANTLLSSGQFGEAAKTYSEAIELSPVDYVLYYKRATAYFSSNRHSNALEDFDKVLSLTSDTFDNAFLMKAKIHTKEGNWQAARDALQRYSTKVKDDPSASSLQADISEGESASQKTVNMRRAQLWTACSEAATQVLRIASHSIDIRQHRAECNLAAGEIEGAVLDLSRLTHLTTTSTTSLMRIFRLSYFYLPPPTFSSPTSALSTLKQCLHLDPDSKQCLPAHRLIKSFDKTFAKLEKLTAAEDWRGIISLLVGSGSNKSNFLGDGFARKFEDALEANSAKEQLLDMSRPSSASILLPVGAKVSPRRKEILRAVCSAYVKIGSVRKAEPWCDALLGMDGADNDADGLAGKGEALLAREEWEEAVRTFERAFEASGRSSREILSKLQKAQRLLKQSKQKDYYKVLGVARDADQQTIKKAYRKAAIKAHPDKGGSETKMATVNEAYEVLSKPELRQRFDNGDDPNDPMSQGGGNPFGGGFADSPFSHFFQQGHSGGGGGGGGGGFQFSWGRGR
ncbi:hypothetical protein SERLA73DRAFT_164479 [Serpula lacrymans var. lacrymans S7.3]|uniref:J domain-containing protein n=2 Tax=Serpula lacrymans var. lacrymans TaxID=341189 RepID=F8PEV4_SERL3|nr:uncharacterized protein SERLADRAFT_358917 [Serpula lacrymans var. lacrymans S7.9]EGO04165.1 hypothetical protein SERLA73DRAFT_164479 [Serpula lacrymans var. lacrymans S7.3]EGO30111.1 hypothetical protein SERLADRAFT_358917 [Serpula lacrymans var. lacrymans S7.9]